MVWLYGSLRCLPWALFRRHYRPLRDGRTDHLVSCVPMALGGWLSALYQGRVAAAAINVVAKKPDDWAKGIILCGIVEFYAILSLLASVLLLMNAL